MIKTGSLKVFSKPKVSHLIIDFKASVNVFKFEPLSFTYAMILLPKPYAIQNSIKFLANVVL